MRQKGRRSPRRKATRKIFNDSDELPACGSLKLENQRDKIFVQGQRIPASNLLVPKGAEREDGYLWNGHARSDGAAIGKKTLQAQWLNKGYQPAAIDGVSMFTERKRLESGQSQVTEIDLGNRAKIGALVNPKTGVLVIITRPARTENEKNAHHRFPVYVQSREQLVEAINKKFGKDTVI